eukprot:Clim_evm1s125 gene=Clim_evmTU1s125
MSGLGSDILLDERIDGANDPVAQQRMTEARSRRILKEAFDKLEEQLNEIEGTQRQRSRAGMAETAVKYIRQQSKLIDEFNVIQRREAAVRARLREVEAKRTELAMKQVDNVPIGFEPVPYGRYGFEDQIKARHTKSPLIRKFLARGKPTIPVLCFLLVERIVDGAHAGESVIKYMNPESHKLVFDIDVKDCVGKSLEVLNKIHNMPPEYDRVGFAHGFKSMAMLGRGVYFGSNLARKKDGSYMAFDYFVRQYSWNPVTCRCCEIGQAYNFIPLTDDEAQEFYAELMPALLQDIWQWDPTFYVDFNAMQLPIRGNKEEKQQENEPAHQNQPQPQGQGP